MTGQFTLTLREYVKIKAELERLNVLLKDGAITQADFDAKKQLLDEEVQMKIGS